jgi:hypothetical protein
MARAAKSLDDKYYISLYQPSDCDDCNEYSTEILETLTAPEVGWSVRSFETMHGSINPHFRGIALLVKDPNNPPKAAIVLAGTLKDAKIKFVVAPAESIFHLPEQEVGLLVGPREGQ